MRVGKNIIRSMPGPSKHEKIQGILRVRQALALREEKLRVEALDKRSHSKPASK